jgi:hypothetical protein
MVPPGPCAGSGPRSSPAARPSRVDWRWTALWSYLKSINEHECESGPVDAPHLPKHSPRLVASFVVVAQLPPALQPVYQLQNPRLTQFRQAFGRRTTTMMILKIPTQRGR